MLILDARPRPWAGSPVSDQAGSVSGRAAIVDSRGCGIRGEDTDDGWGQACLLLRRVEPRGPGDRRSLRRAALLAGLLGVTEPGPPVLTVVGSKGKGTAATYASAWLVAAGCRVVTVTSPGLRSDAERIRVDGAAVSPDELAGLARRLQRASRSLPSARDGYLSPSGLFTLAGLLHARDAGADVVVLEAGMGGVSDEAGLFPPSVVAITEVFGEHLGVLGDTPAEIAADKAGVAAETTSAVVSLPQTPAVAAAIAATVAAAGAGRVETIDLARTGPRRNGARKPQRASCREPEPRRPR